MATSVPSYLSISDQACNECKRRKGRCDRQLPECGPCARNKRHCLYERQGKTPLTRKYLQEVEARLRQTEWRAAEAERRANEAETTLNQLTTGSSDQLVPVPSAVDSLRSSLTPGSGGLPDIGLNGLQQHVPASDLELPPGESNDFSWDEQTATDVGYERPQSAASQLEDGDLDRSLASLTVEDRGAGYLGVASGAAVLKLMLPQSEHRRASTRIAGAPKTEMARSTSTADQGWVPTPVYNERRIGTIDLDQAINNYFSFYHLCYPIVHEPTFRAQYAQVIPRPSGRTWNALAYVVAAIGMFTTANELSTRDIDLYEAAKANLSIDTLETGNLTLVQVFALMANYVQKRNKPNSGYNYLGLALHTAMGLGLHKEFRNWQISPLNHEIRRRVWWMLNNFAMGATITFGRPISWPTHGIEVALPLNIHDRDLTNISRTLPPPQAGVTVHTLLGIQARFHLATNDIYAQVISAHSSSAAEMLRADDERIEPWRALWLLEDDAIPPPFKFSQATMVWRYRNLRIIMYRPFLLRQILQSHSRDVAADKPADQAAQTAINRCMDEAKQTIYSVREFWAQWERNCMTAWYCLYFMFQASMIPCICLRNDPRAQEADDWRQQIEAVLELSLSVQSLAPAGRECFHVISRLCEGYLKPREPVVQGQTLSPQQPTDESPQTQINNVYSMMWPHAHAAEFDAFIPDESWMAFLNDFETTSPAMATGSETNITWTSLS